MKILGISSGHDSGAAIIEDGKIVCAVNEERLSRKKGHWGHPFLAIKKCFEISGIDPKEIFEVAVANITRGGGVQRNFKAGTFRKRLVDLLSYTGLMDKQWVKWTYLSIFKRLREEPDLIQFLHKIGVKAAVSYVEHHQAHAATAYYASPFSLGDRVLVITSDSSGDGLSTTISVIGANGEIIRKHETSFYHSPSVIYSYVTHNLGFKYLRHEGKITGLAAFGDAKKTIEIFRKLISVDTKSLQFRSHIGAWGRPAARKVHLLLQGYKREDIAAGVQARIEEVCAELVTAGVRRYNCNKICFAGGIFANVKLNQKILELPEVREIYVFPHMGDGGIAVGSALEVWAGRLLKSGKAAHSKKLDNVYLGPKFKDEEIERVLKDSGVVFHRSQNVEKEIAGQLVKGKIVVRFAGRMEYGPRALGNRSILYVASDPSVNAWLNKQLGRTEFMPFAPIVLASKAADYFENFDLDASVPAEFMTMTYFVTELCRKQAPAIVHVDGTARPQIVYNSENQSVANILFEYEKLTGKAILVNTSFNMHEEPIVCTPQDAIRAFQLGNLDVLAIENFIVENKSGEE